MILLNKLKSREGSQPSPNLNRLDSSAVSQTDAADYLQQSHKRNQKEAESQQKDLWNVAYKELSDRERQFLSKLQPTTPLTCVDGHEHRVSTLDLVNEVIQLTETQYVEYQQGGWKIRQGLEKEDINLRDVAQRLLNATLSFKDIISALVTFDPTSHTSSAWTIISLGLTVCFF